MSKIIIIGAGPSGIIAALQAVKKHEVILLERNEQCGKKILLTGNGKCNYWNEKIDVTKYQTDDVNILEKILDKTNQENVFEYLESIGIYPRVKNGYYYPYSNQASSIRKILLSELKRQKIEIITDFKVENIYYENKKFLITSNHGKVLQADKIILATGSKATPKTGSDGSGYILASKLGHTVNTVTPALSPLIAKENFLKDWNGVRAEVKISLYINDKKIKEETGEIQLTNYGISGICTFNISGIVSKNLKLNNDVYVKINFFPYFNSDFYNFLEIRNKKMKDHTIEELLESIINYKLMFVLLKKANINKSDKWDDLSKKEKMKLCNTIEAFKLKIYDTADFDKAQVCTGGISLKEINSNTMESKIVPNLFLVGELLDVDGNCGGFNLAFAWISGYLAGKGV